MNRKFVSRWLNFHPIRALQLYRSLHFIIVRRIHRVIHVERSKFANGVRIDVRPFVRKNRFRNVRRLVWLIRRIFLFNLDHRSSFLWNFLMWSNRHWNVVWMERSLDLSTNNIDVKYRKSRNWSTEMINRLPYRSIRIIFPLVCR